MSPDRILPGSAGVPDAPPPEDDPLDTLDATVDDAPLFDEEQSSSVTEDEFVDDAPDAPSTDVDGVVAIEIDSRASVTTVVEDDTSTESFTENAFEPAGTHTGGLRRIYYGETRIDFIRRRNIWFTFSLVLILAGAISLGVRGLNFGIDFVGGTSWIVPSKTMTVQEAEASLGGLVHDPQITVLGVFNSAQRTVKVAAKLPEGQTAAKQQQIADDVSTRLAAAAHTSVGEVAVQAVGPSWGGQITHKAIVALIVFFILIAMYISVFFEWRMALAAIIAVLHDIVITVGIYSLSGFEVHPDTVVAILTILGYSLYDTIVVFDRIRDNAKHLSIRDRLTFSDLVNLSMNQTLARSINTTAVAIMPILSLLVLGALVLGASTLQYFGLALLVGLAAGAYSSIFVASPLVAMLKEREPKYRILRERLTARGANRIVLSASAVASGAFAELFEARGSGPGAKKPASTRQSSLTNTSRPTPKRRTSSRGKPKGGRR